MTNINCGYMQHVLMQTLVMMTIVMIVCAGTAWIEVNTELFYS